jgi:hypothetical protein
MIYLYIILVLSLAINGFLGWYCFNLLKDRISLFQVFKLFTPSMKEYENHLIALTKMDIYFGDPTIMSLVEHTKEINQQLDNFMQSVEIEEADENTE